MGNSNRAESELAPKDGAAVLPIKQVAKWQEEGMSRIGAGLGRCDLRYDLWSRNMGSQRGRSSAVWVVQRASGGR